MAQKEYTICKDIKWINVTDPTQQEMYQLAEQYGLNQYIVRDSMEPEHLPKYEEVEGVHFLLVRFYAHNFDKRIATVQDITNKIALFYTDTFLLTIHKHETPFLEVIYQKQVRSSKCDTVGEVIAKILWFTLETYEAPAERLSEQVDFYETGVMLRKSAEDLTESLYQLKRQASMCHKMLMLLGEPINHVHSMPKDDPALQDVRDQHLKMLTLYNQALEDINNLMGMYMSYAAQRTNEVMKVLTLFSAFFLPLTFIAGIYGMNFEYMPELTKKWSYPAVLLLMAAIAGIIYSWFRRKKWL